MIEKDFELAFKNETETSQTLSHFEAQTLSEKQDKFIQEKNELEHDMHTYFNKKEKKLFHIFFFILIPVLCGFSIDFSWSVHLSLGGYWQASNEHARRLLITLVTMCGSIVVSGFLGAIFAHLSTHFLTKKLFKLVKNKKETLEQAIQQSQEKIVQFLSHKKNRFELLHLLEYTINLAKQQYCAEFIEQQGLSLMKFNLEQAYLRNDISLIQDCMKEIFTLPKKLEEQWLTFNAKEIEKEKKSDTNNTIKPYEAMKAEYWTYLKEEGKEIFDDDIPLNILVKHNL